MNESEWQTRKRRIDARLRSCNPGWELVPWQAGLDVSTLRCHAVTEFPTANGPADYALFVAGKLLAIIEAKKVTVNIGPDGPLGCTPMRLRTHQDLKKGLPEEAQKWVSNDMSQIMTDYRLNQRESRYYRNKEPEKVGCQPIDQPEEWAS